MKRFFVYFFALLCSMTAVAQASSQWRDLSVYELGYQKQRITTQLLDKESGKVSVTNGYDLCDLNNVRLHWVLYAEGEKNQEGTVDTLNIPAHKTATYTLPYQLYDPDVEVTLNVYYELKTAEQHLPAGHVLARQQFVIFDYTYDFAVAVTKEDGHKNSISFDKQTGYIKSLVMDGQSVLADGGTIMPFLGCKYTPTLTSLKTKKNVTTATYDVPDMKSTLTMTYTIDPEGCIVINQKLTPQSDAEATAAKHFGMVMQLPYAADKCTYYGLGTEENYLDRCQGPVLGLYDRSADELCLPASCPHKTGLKSGIRWWDQGGLRFMSDNAFSASARRDADGKYTQLFIENDSHDFNVYIFKRKTR